MKFPYGLSDFSKLMDGDFFYQDRTHLIPLIEGAGDQLLFLRPRRSTSALAPDGQRREPLFPGPAVSVVRA
ncbi:hypothetical protein CCP4SC76_6130001 [Gammaproteobacteria bacterium]